MATTRKPAKGSSTARKRQPSAEKSSSARTRGRPSLLTDELTSLLAGYIAAGNTVEVACAAAGISARTYREWMQRGRSGLKRDAPFREFRECVEQAMDRVESRLVLRIAAAAERGSWQAARYLLERRFPERWAPSHDEGLAGPPAEPEADEFADLDNVTPIRGRRR